MKKVLIIVGPSASGKSALAVELARIFDGEVISADSRQVYRGLNIGTGKITPREMKGVSHHLLDVASPRTKFTADDYMRRAQKAIEDISKHGKLPIVAGGTGFYIDALVGRITLADVPPNPTLRKKLTAKSAEQLFKILEKKDPDRAVSMNTPSERNNKLRLIRALEIAESRQPYGGRSSVKRSKTLSHNNEYSPLRRTVLRKGALTYDALWIGIIPTQQVLEKKISTRLLYRLRHGMIAEAKRLHATGLSYKRMGELGLEYRSLARFLQKNISRKELEEELVRDITRYTKKQMMYWNRNVDITWFKPTELKKIRSRISLWYKKP